MVTPAKVMDRTDQYHWHGASVIGERSEKDIIETVQFALDEGINYFDLYAGHAAVFPAYGKALYGHRKEAMLQIHFGADYTTGEYGWTTNPDKVKKSVDWQLKNLKTDYIDFGFIHCLDEEADLNAYEKNGILEYLMDITQDSLQTGFSVSAD